LTNYKSADNLTEEGSLAFSVIAKVGAKDFCMTLLDSQYDPDYTESSL